MMQFRGGFSDRMNLGSLCKTMQFTEFMQDTRIQIYNFIVEQYNIVVYDTGHNMVTFERRQKCLAYIQRELLREIVQYYDDANVGYLESKVFEKIKAGLLHGKYNEVLDVLEFFVKMLRNLDVYNKWNLCELANELLEREFVGYRFVSKFELSPITNETEIAEIKRVMINSDDGIRKHIEKALTLLSNRENPDYANSVKESITAVEAMCRRLVGNEKATLGDALAQIGKKGIVIHGALREAFSKLYGYTSDADGIRHANGVGGQQTTMAEAQFMLVSCSAFINYLKISNER